MMGTALLQELVTAQAGRWPELPAVAWRRTDLNYRELDERSNQLARSLRDAGCRRGDQVCMLLPRSPEAVVALLGILKADGIVVTLDLATPPSRLAEVLRVCEPRCVLTLSSGGATLDELFRRGALASSVAVGSLGSSPIVGEHFSTQFCAIETAQMPSKPVSGRNRPLNPAQIVFNSNSRGVPRGVVLTHANIRRLLLWSSDHFGVIPGDRHIWCSVPSEGMSTFATLGTLAAGATLYPVPSDFGCHPARLAQFVRDAGLTLWMVTPQTLTGVAELDLVRSGDFPQLRHLVWHGGELQPGVLRHWMTRVRHVTFTRLYGTTEATVVNSSYRVPSVPDEETPLPIGRARPGDEVLVLDDQLKPVLRDQLGELHIRGLGLSPGYWRDPAATEAAFLRNPHQTERVDRLFRTGDLGRVNVDGQIYLHGRRDRRVDHDAELNEIEAALARLGSIRTAVVVALRTDETTGPVFGCAYVPLPGLDVTSAALRDDLAAMLPSALLPSRWMACEHLPRTADGTVDHGEIRRGFAANTGAPSVPPQTVNVARAQSSDSMSGREGR